MVDDGWTDDGRTTDGRTTEHGYTISSLCEPDGSGELNMLYLEDVFSNFSSEVVYCLIYCQKFRVMLTPLWSPINKTLLHFKINYMYSLSHAKRRDCQDCFIL